MHRPGVAVGKGDVAPLLTPVTPAEILFPGNMQSSRSLNIAENEAL